METANMSRKSPYPVAKIFSSKKHRMFDQKTIESGVISGFQLMKNAGSKAAEITLQYYPLSSLASSQITVICGKGGNGGDGLIVTSYFLKKGLTVKAIMLCKEKDLLGDTLKSFKLGKTEGLKISFKDRLNEKDLEGSSLIIDAILGTGFNGSAKSEIADAINLINTYRINKDCHIVSLDLPSGANANLFSQTSSHIIADQTMSFGFKKPFHVSPEGIRSCGIVEVIDIGLSEPSYENEMADAIEIKSIELPSRPKEGFKGTFGHVLIVGGSQGLYGAPILSAMAALKSGAGLVTAFLPKDSGTSLPSYPPELMIQRGQTEKIFSAQDIEVLKKIIKEKKITSIAIGMGLGQNSGDFLKEAIIDIGIPMVVDADGLSCLKEYSTHKNMILTPHPGEYLKYFSPETPNSFEELQKKSNELSATIIYKSTCPVICFPGSTPEVVANPVSALAKAGSGDILAGILAGLCGQSHLSLKEAVRLSLLAHNKSGESASKITGDYASSASDIVSQISDAIRKLSLKEAGD